MGESLIMNNKCDLCDCDATTVLTVNIPSSGNGIKQWITNRCEAHLHIDYEEARQMINEKVSKKLEVIHKKSINNKGLIDESSNCGCFYCKSLFQGSEITKTKDNNKTALCPSCSVDAVLVSDTDLVIDEALLTAMYAKYFEVE